MLESRLKGIIRNIPDYPKPGIAFKDITPILSEPSIVRQITAYFKMQLKGTRIDAIACVESRGFWFGTILAYEMNLPIIPIRKKGKLPYKTVSMDYDLEYGSATIEAHEDSIGSGQNILIHDDLLATGGTAAATAELIKQSDGNVAGFSFLVNLNFLEGEIKLKPFTPNILSIVNY